jgi:AraC-like DNA-binding protein
MMANLRRHAYSKTGGCRDGYVANLRQIALGLRHRTAIEKGMHVCDGFTYFSVGPDDMKQEVYVTSVGRLTYPSGAEYPGAGHPSGYAFDWRRGRTLGDFAVVFVERGRGEFEARDSGRRAWPANDILLLPPGIWHRYRPCPTTGWTERWLCLNGELLFRLLAKGLFPAQPVLRRVPARRAFLDAWSRVHAAQRNSLRVAAFALEALAVALQDWERECDVRSSISTTDAVVNKALEFIWHNCQRPLTVSLVAANAGVARRTLERRFASLRRCGIAKEIECARLERARQLLGETSMLVKQVGFTVGFGVPARLIRVFRNRFGTTPAEYRRQLSQAIGGNRVPNAAQKPSATPMPSDIPR